MGENRISMMLKIVRSQAKDDCGVCAVACATGHRWQQVDDILFNAISGKPASRRTTGKKLISILSWLGHWSPQKQMKGVRLPVDDCWSADWKEVPVNGTTIAIVKIQYEDARCSHWVVFDGEWVYDSNEYEPIHVRRFSYMPLGYIILEKELF